MTTELDSAGREVVIHRESTDGGVSFGEERVVVRPDRAFRAGCAVCYLCLFTPFGGNWKDLVWAPGAEPSSCCDVRAPLPHSRRRKRRCAGSRCESGTVPPL